MAQPQAKKQKTDNVSSARSAIVFESQGLKADVCLKIFDQEFHVNSMVMKVHCGFFRTFLEPSGGIMPFSTSAAFTSQWFTALDDFDDECSCYMSWLLSADHKVSIPSVSWSFKVFEKFLCALFDRRYEIETARELDTLADLERYYIAVPAVSTSLYSALMQSPKFYTHILRSPETVIRAAISLKNEILLRDNLNLSLGPWSAPVFHYFDGSQERMLANTAYGIVCSKIMQAEMAVLNAVTAKEAKSSAATTRYSTTAAAESTSAKKLGIIAFAIGTTIEAALVPVLENNLTLAPSAVAGQREFADYFLCLNANDFQLPWD
ncbi:hypothetical protein BDZ45DRAFT_612272, partial [Acephala macrosclerotiorum]